MAWGARGAVWGGPDRRAARRGRACPGDAHTPGIRSARDAGRHAGATRARAACPRGRLAVRVMGGMRQASEVLARRRPACEQVESMLDA